MRICLLASGSKGNAIYLETRDTRLLIDAGLSARELERRMAAIGADPGALNALLVSHEHSDHCRGIGPMARRWSLPVYLHHATHDALTGAGRLDRISLFDSGEPISLRDLQIEAVPLTHDAAAPVGFIVHTQAGRLGIATDLGLGTRLVADRYQGCRALILEANHDEEMLRDGPYPWHLKQRIRSRHGHLSNRESAELLKQLLWDGLEAVFLAHLSETNNRPQLAKACAEQVLAGQTACNPHLIMGCQERPSACFNL